MPRKSRNYVKASFFHIMVQGINKEYIFSEDEDKKKYLELIKQIREYPNIIVISYCIMNNHVHLLLKTDLIEKLSQFMHKINTLYAIYYNQKYNRVGYVYRGRYKSQVIYSEKQLYACINYIHNNPVKANICRLAHQYEYSSFKNFNKNIEEFNNSIKNDFMEENVLAKKDIIFIEDENEIEEEIQGTISKYLSENKLIFDDFKNNKEHLEKIATILKNNYNLSLRKIAMYLNVGREKLRCTMSNKFIH